MVTIIQVALPVPLMQLFHYLPKDEQIPVKGVRVKVPFGRRQLIGIVVDSVDNRDLPTAPLKKLLEILDSKPLFSSPVWQLLQWAAAYYQYPLGEVLQKALPKGLRQGKPAVIAETLRWELTPLGHTMLLHTASHPNRAPRQQAALRQLQSSLSGSIHSTPAISPRLLRTLQTRGLVQAHRQTTALPCPGSLILPTDEQVPQLNAEQQVAVSQMSQQLEGFGVWLLQGVTGSGKTEVYLRLLAQVLAQGKQALLLVPEISLTHQTIERLRRRLPVQIVVLHSALRNSERLASWLAARDGAVSLVVGTRSALFAPLQRLGLVIVDEEHDLSYKQQSGWRYHARDLAVLRAHYEGIPILLGSATPALETLHNVQQGKYRQLLLTQRAGGAEAVQQQLLDLKGQPLTAGIAPELLARIRQHLQADNQVLLFLNRRGYAPALLCHDCGWLATCLRCERYYTLHQASQRLCCHHCSSQRAVAHQCARCGSTHLITAGIGTEQLESKLQQLLPQIPIQRIDHDSTRLKGALAQQLNTIHQGGAQLLIGTQMLAKGHHFPDVTLVALLDIDGALFSADYRAAERLAQLYTQVSGRAGRASKPGEVVLQTHHPQHPLLQTLLMQGYTAFSEQLLEERRLASLPPYVSQVLLLAEDFESQRASDFLSAVRQLLEQPGDPDSELWLLGPSPALQAKRAGYFRWQLLLQHPSRGKLQQLLHTHYPQITVLPLARKIKWSVDVDPVEG
jgi:primosomal protein N' (replication factor Y) (superfamily II helicase)